jgi:glutamyl-tRNA synthetase
LHYREEGNLPQALLNYLVRLGWSYGDQEIFSREQMIELFDIKDINPSASAFNPEKLLWLNQHYLKSSDYKQCAADLQWQMQRQHIDLTQGPDLERVFDVQKGRTKSLRDIAEQSRIFYDDFDNYDQKALNKHLKPYAAGVLRDMLVALEQITDWSQDHLHEVVKGVTESHGLKMGKVAQPLRVALTGGVVSPAIDLTLMLVEKRRSLQRIQRAIELIESRSRDGQP